MADPPHHHVAQQMSSPSFKVPSLPYGHVPRPRVTRFIDEPYLAPLTLIVAEAGTGKTTLASEWAHDASTNVGWVSVDDSNRDASCFSVALNQALQFAVASFLDSPETLFESVRSLEHDACLVIDNWELVTDPGSTAMLEALLSIKHSRLKLMISGRTAPSLRLGRMRAQGRVRELATDDLLLTQPEAEAVAREIMNDEPTPEQVERLVSAAGGWVAGLVLLAQARRRPAASGAHGSASTQLLDEYIEQEILAAVPPDIRDFALAISTLPFLTPEICAVTLDVGDCRDLLRSLEARFPFVHREVDHPDRLRFHPLIGQSLARLASSEVPEATARERRLAEWLLDGGYIEEAGSVALRMRDLATMATVLKPLCEHLAKRSHFEELGHWLAHVPESIFGKHLDFAWWRFLAQAGQGRIDGAAASLDEIEPRALASREPIYRGRVLLARGGMAVLMGRDTEGRGQLNDALRHLPESALTERMHAATLLGEVAFRQGSDLEAARAFHQAERYARQLPLDELWSWGIIAPGRANGYAIRGDIHSAITKYQLIIAEIPPHLAHKGIDGFVRCRLPSLYIERNDLDTARHELDRVEAQLDGTHRSWYPDAVVAKARLLFAEGRLEDAEEWAAAHLRELRRTPGKSQLVHVLARIWLERGEYPMVKSWLADVSSIEPPADHIYGDTDYRLLAIDLSMAQGHYEAVVEQAEQMAQAAAARRRWAKVITLSARQAVALHCLGQVGRARDVFRSALDRGARGGFIRSLEVQGFDPVTLFGDVWPEKPEYEPVRRAMRSLQGQQAQRDVRLISRREQEVLLLVAEGRTNQQIATALFISTNTVRNHLVRICQRLEAHNRSEAVARARELGLLDQEWQSAT